MARAGAPGRTIHGVVAAGRGVGDRLRRPRKEAQEVEEPLGEGVRDLDLGHVPDPLEEFRLSLGECSACCLQVGMGKHAITIAPDQKSRELEVRRRTEEVRAPGGADTGQRRQRPRDLQRHAPGGGLARDRE